MTKILKIHLSLCTAMVVGLAAPQPVSAQSAPALSGLFACEAISNAEAQLSCFQIETAKLRGVASPSTSTSTSPSASSSSGPIFAPSAAPVVTDSLAAQKETLALERQQLAAEKDRLAAEKKRVAALEKQMKDKANPPKERTVAIVSTSRFGPNRFIRFTLENGEVWQQTEAAYVRLGRGDPDMMTLKRTSFGGSTGRVNGKAPTLRLKQVK
jgi:hypothetical protein